MCGDTISFPPPLHDTDVQPEGRKRLVSRYAEVFVSFKRMETEWGSMESYHRRRVERYLGSAFRLSLPG